jgi:Tfp pilus assembly protein PilZ
MHHQRNAQDISLGGMRVFSDETFTVGDRLDLEVFLPDGAAVRVWVLVVWVTKLESGAESKFEVGMQFTDIGEADVQRLASVLSRPT